MPEIAERRSVVLLQEPPDVWRVPRIRKQPIAILLHQASRQQGQNQPFQVSCKSILQRQCLKIFDANSPLRIDQSKCLALMLSDETTIIGRNTRRRRIRLASTEKKTPTPRQDEGQTHTEYYYRRGPRQVKYDCENSAAKHRANSKRNYYQTHFAAPVPRGGNEADSICLIQVESVGSGLTCPSFLRVCTPPLGNPGPLLKQRAWNNTTASVSGEEEKIGSEGSWGAFDSPRGFGLALPLEKSAANLKRSCQHSQEQRHVIEHVALFWRENLRSWRRWWRGLMNRAARAGCDEHPSVLLSPGLMTRISKCRTAGCTAVLLPPMLFASVWFVSVCTAAQEAL